LIVGGRRWGASRGASWSPDTLEAVLWWCAVTLGLRGVVEPVIVTYYLWPALAVALIAASRDWSRLVPASAAAVTMTLVSQGAWRGLWTWWAPAIALLVLTLAFARYPLRLSRHAAEHVHLGGRAGG
jgi:hypothetical protein